MNGRTVEAYERSVALLGEAATPAGFVASPAFDHYAVIWARDGLISALGALITDETALTDASAATLDTLSRHASPFGQIRPWLRRPRRSGTSPRGVWSTRRRGS